MDMPAALRARLIANSAVNAIVSGRVYWGIRPENSAMPALRLQAVGGSDTETIKGAAVLMETRVQVDCLATTYAASRALANAVRAAVKEPATNNGVQFGFSASEPPRDLGDDTTGGYVFRASLDLLVRHYSA